MQSNTNKQSANYVLGYESKIVDMLNTHNLLREGRFFISHLKPGMRILDVGCGPGSISISFARCFPYITIVGIDIDQGQITQARDAARHQGLDNIEFHVADVYALPFESESFDAIFAHTLFMHLAKPKAALQDLFRVIKSHGIIGIREGISGFESFTDLALPRRFNSLGELFKQTFDKSQGVLDIGIKLKGLLHESGFDDIKISSHAEVYDQPDDLETLKSWYQSTFSTTLGQEILKHGILSPEELKALIASMSNWPQDPGALSILCWVEYLAQKSNQPQINNLLE